MNEEIEQIINAINDDEIEIISNLINENPEIINQQMNNDNFVKTIFHYVIEHGSEELLSWIIENHYQMIDFESSDSNDNTALHLAVINNIDEEIFDELFSDKVPLDLKNNEGNTILHLSIINNNVHFSQAIIDMICRDGDNDKDILDFKNNDGNTPLHISTINECFLVLEILINNNADFFIKNNEDNDVLDLIRNKLNNLNNVFNQFINNSLKMTLKERMISKYDKQIEKHIKKLIISEYRMKNSSLLKKIAFNENKYQILELFCSDYVLDLLINLEKIEISIENYKNEMNKKNQQIYKNLKKEYYSKFKHLKPIIEDEKYNWIFEKNDFFLNFYKFSFQDLINWEQLILNDYEQFISNLNYNQSIINLEKIKHIKQDFKYYYSDEFDQEAIDYKIEVEICKQLLETLIEKKEKNEEAFYTIGMKYIFNDKNELEKKYNSELIKIGLELELDKKFEDFMKYNIIISEGLPLDLSIKNNIEIFKEQEIEYQKYQQKQPTINFSGSLLDDNQPSTSSGIRYVNDPKAAESYMLTKNLQENLSESESDNGNEIPRFDLLFAKDEKQLKKLKDLQVSKSYKSPKI